MWFILVVDFHIVALIELNKSYYIHDDKGKVNEILSDMDCIAINNHLR